MNIIRLVSDTKLQGHMQRIKRREKGKLLISGRIALSSLKEAPPSIVA